LITGQSGGPIFRLPGLRTEEGEYIMEKTVYNPQKGRLETIDITFTDKNTNWFDFVEDDPGISFIADVQGGLVIADHDYSYPILIYGVSRSDIEYDRQKALILKQTYIHT